MPREEYTLPNTRAAKDSTSKISHKQAIGSLKIVCVQQISNRKKQEITNKVYKKQ